MRVMEKVSGLFSRGDGARVKVPTVLQMEATECGAAALGMVLAHYGLWIPLELLRQECGVNRDGSKASCVLRAARARHCVADGYRWTAGDLLKMVPSRPFPLIIHWEFNHFVVLEGIKDGVAYLNDPAMGRRTVPWEEFRTSYTGVALQIKPGEGFVKEGKRYSVYADIWKKLREDKWALAFILILELCAIIPGLASPVMSQIFMDDILTRKHPDWMFNFCLAMTVSFLATGAISLLRAVVLTAWQRKLTLADSSSYFWHLLRLPMQFFHQRYAAEVAGRVGFNEAVAGVLSGPAATAGLDFLVAVFYLLLLLQYNVTLTLIGVAFSSVGIILFFAMRRHLTDLNMRIQQDAGKAYGVAMNGLRMIETIKANGDEADFFTKWAGYQTKLLSASQETAMWQLSVTLLPTLLGGINGALIMTFGGFSIMDGAMTAGMFMAFQNLMGSFQAPVNALMGLAATLQTTEMQMQRLNDVRRYKADTLNFPEGGETRAFPRERLSGALSLSGVSFGYSPLAKPLLTDFDMRIRPGGWVAVVGASGSGKSTLAKIVTGLYREWSGTVAFDGVAREKLPRAVIMNSVAAVDQDIFLITGTVAENIALFDASVAKGDIVRAAKDACIHEDIMKLEGGYEAKVAEGGLNFSGGQRQRLEIARALAVNPSLLVLDEATSALDPITEKSVLENIRHRGCSCLIVAHRLSTIRDCDEIIVLEQGVVAERGTHREMMKHEGPYRRLIEEREAGSMRVKLGAGERLELGKDNRLARVVSGSVEAYAVTAGDASFRQFYLMTLGAGEAAFPAMDEFGEIAVVLSAAEDAELEETAFDDEPPETLKPLMQSWFKNLGEIPWLRLLADKGDDILRSWRDGTVLEAADGHGALMAAFTESEQIFSMFLGMEFGSEDKRLSRRVKMRAWGKRMLVENSIRILLGEAPLHYEAAGEDGGSVGEAAFVMAEVAKALGMPCEGIRISAGTAKRLDQVGLLRRLAQKGNMQTRLVTLPDGWHRQDIGVMVGFWGEEKHLAALLPDTPEHYRAVTAAHPEGIPVTDEAARQIAKDAFACYAGFPARALKVMDLLKFMFRQCWKADYRAILVTSFIAGLIPLATPVITETIFQDIIPILDRQGLATVTQALMVTSFTTAALSVVRSIAVMRISTKIEISSEAALWGRLLSLPPKFFRRYTVGELAGRMGGLGVVKGLVSGEFVGTVFGFIFSFWSVLLMCYYSIKLTVAAAGVWVVYSLFEFFVLRRVLEFQRQIIAAGNKTAGTVQQIFAGLQKFRVQGAEEQAYHLWSRDFGEHWNWELKLRWQNNYTAILSSVQPFVLSMLLYYIAVNGTGEPGAGGKAAQQGIGYAQFMAFSAAYSGFNAVFGQVIGLVGTFFGIQPQLENLRPILQEVPESAGEKADAETLTGAVEVSHLSFAYEGGAEVLHDVSFRVRAGENVAIVGKSGCGKSTLVRCLLGFETPTKGGVYYDGQDLTELSLPSVRTQMGVVLQNGQLMTGDIFTNIVGTRLLTQDDAWEAAEAAGVARDIAEMPMGMQTVISEGSSNISGGQRQRLLIARALVGKPAILIFDEATSALDNRSQSIVTESLDRLKATRIVVAHRLSTIRGCDRVIVMDEGRVAEEGGFDELVEKGGIFAELVKRQVA